MQIQEICPYHNIKSAVYPHILVTCSSSDVRVPACGPAKWVAKLREHQEGTAPVLLLSNANAGHFGHEADLVDNTALEYAFLLQALLQSTNKDRHSGSCSG